MKISLLIPVFNYDIVNLVCSMKDAMGKVPELYEILIGDDGSSAEFNAMYRSLEEENVRVISSEKNIGRAAIRNRLAIEAKGDFCLFIDADVMIPGTAEAYLSKWIPFLSKSKVICGGILYNNAAPGDPDKFLRWRYGKWMEQRSATERNKHPNDRFSTFNVMIERSVFSRIRFDEELKQYGYEDTLMGYQLKNAGINILHIDNGLIHEGLESNHDFITKTKLGIENLSILYDKVTDKKAFSNTVILLKIYNKLRYLGLTQVLATIFNRNHQKMEIKLESRRIPIVLFSIYKISMFCAFREIHIKKDILPVF